MGETLDIHGVALPDEPDILYGGIRRAITKGRYEKDEIVGLPNFVTAKDKVVELGAGLGVISSYLALHLGVTDICCIEANPKLADYIARTHATNGLEGLTVQNCLALGEDQATSAGDSAPFYIRDPFWGSSMDGSETYTNVVDVPVRRLDTLLKERDASVLIVDIEGGETSLFEGLDLGPVQSVYLELHTRRTRMIGVRKVFDDLSAAGFCYDQKVSAGRSVLFRRIPDWQLEQA